MYHTQMSRQEGPSRRDTCISGRQEDVPSWYMYVSQAAKKAPAKPPTAERPKGRKRDAEEAAEAPEEAPSSAKKGRGSKKGGKWAIIHSKGAHDTCNMTLIHVSRRDLHVLCVPVFRLYYTVY
jgi:hypothetical protein